MACDFSVDDIAVDDLLSGIVEPDDVGDALIEGLIQDPHDCDDGQELCALADQLLSDMLDWETRCGDDNEAEVSEAPSKPRSGRGGYRHGVRGGARNSAKNVYTTLRDFWRFLAPNRQW